MERMMAAAPGNVIEDGKSVVSLIASKYQDKVNQSLSMHYILEANCYKLYLRICKKHFAFSLHRTSMINAFTKGSCKALLLLCLIDILNI